MSILQHTSVENALSLAPPLFFLSIGTTDELTEGVEDVEYLQARAQHYIQRASELLNTPRTGWTKPERGIPKELQETRGAHMLKVSIAAYKIPDGLLKWHLMRGESPSQELWELYRNTHTRIRLSRKGFFHDFQEWGSNPDFTPGQVTQEEQDNIELKAVREYARIYGDDFPLKMYESMQEKTHENELIFNLDKMDAAVMALNYQRLGCNVDEFFPYTALKLTLPMMREILEILIKHKDKYPEIDFFIQYDSLLFHGGNLKHWQREMDGRMQYGASWELREKLGRLKIE